MKCLNCFHELPYWHKLLITHLLDPMHMFKNIPEILWEHIMGKHDSLRARNDLETMQHTSNLWVDEDGELLAAPWALNKKAQAVVKRTIKNF